MGELLVSRNNLRECRVGSSAPPQPADGQALLRVSGFGMTANNVTYALMGDAMRYWEFFPAPEGWGLLPTWGFAEVAASRARGVEDGTRLFGFLPAADHLLVTPAGAGERGFVDASEHRATLPSAYHRYLSADFDPFYQREYEDQQMLLRPLFFTAFLLDDELGDGGLAGARSVVLSSASSKTAIATAFLAAQREGVEVVGLTSPANTDFLSSLRVYDRLLPYAEVASLEVDRAVFVDIAGDSSVREGVHRHLGDRLTASIAVGMTHWEELGGEADELPGPTPRFFFAPDRVIKRSADWGREGLERRTADAWIPFVEWAAGWMEIIPGEGLEAARDAYLEVAGNRVAPAKAHVVSLSPPA